METKVSFETLLSELEQIPTYQERIDIIANDIISQTNRYEELARNDMHKFLSLLSDKTMDDAEDIYWRWWEEWNTIRESHDGNEEKIIYYLEGKISDERFNYLFETVSQYNFDYDEFSDMLSEAEKEIVVEAYNEYQRTASSLELYCTVSRQIELKSSDGTKLHFEQWFDDGYPGQFNGPYEIDEGSWGGEIQMDIW